MESSTRMTRIVANIISTIISDPQFYLLPMYASKLFDLHNGSLKRD